MTTFVSRPVTTTAPTVDGRRVLEALASVREWGESFGAAFRASARTPRPEGMDRTALLMFGRD